MQRTVNDITTFYVFVSVLIFAMIFFIIAIIIIYRKHQVNHEKDITQLKLVYDKTLLNTQLEIQEQTFQHISREIHDNINLSLTLAKLQLNTFDWQDREKSSLKLEMSINLLSNSIADLSDISRSMNADLIAEQGLLKALEEEVKRIQEVEIFQLDYCIQGSPVFMESTKELIIFRIIQEAFNNIIKHARAREVRLRLNYMPEILEIEIRDNGRGFDRSLCSNSKQAGLKNMETRVKILKGEMKIISQPGKGTTLQFTIPIITV